jgi:hypothetical protein
MTVRGAKLSISFAMAGFYSLVAHRDADQQP